MQSTKERSISPGPPDFKIGDPNRKVTPCLKGEEFRLRAQALEEGKMRMRKVELKGRVRYKGKGKGNKMGRILHIYLYFFLIV